MATPKTRKKPSSTSSRRPVRPGSKATRSEKAQVSLIKTILSKSFLVVAAAVLAGGALLLVLFLWFSRVYADPENVFWGMLSNNLATSSITKELTQESGQGSTLELTQLSLTPKPTVKSVRVLSYVDETGGQNKLTLEGILTPVEEYQHYADIQRPTAGSQRDYSEIYKLWLKNTPPESSGGSPGFNNAVYGAMLFGNLRRPERAPIIDELRQAYEVDFSKAEKSIVSGRRTYTYQVTVNMRSYAVAALRYAQTLGLPVTNQINPNNYKATDQIQVEITVDVLTRQVKKVEYQGAVNETYRGYGVPVQIALPSKTVAPEKLQKAIEDATR